MKIAAQVALILTLISIGVAQEGSGKNESPDTRQKIYRVNFVIYEMQEGKRINERTYSVPVVTQGGRPQSSSIKVGDRLPILAKEGQFQYFDVGLSIDCRVAEQDDKLIVSSTLEMSSIVSPEQQGGDVRVAGGNPVVRQVKQSFTALVAPGKPTLVTSIDDVNSKKRLEVEVTATRME